MRPPSRPPAKSKRRPPSARGMRPSAPKERAPDRGFVTATERAEIIRGRWSKSRPDSRKRQDPNIRQAAAAETGDARRPPGAKPGTRPKPASVTKPEGGSPSEPMRIAKAIARAGLCSRRDAERWIADARVMVNGRVITSPALDVKPGDKIIVDGEPLPGAEPIRLWRYYKPKGLVTTHRDPEGRPTVFDALPKEMPRVISIGRLDFNTEGLLLLTTDGALARHLELPATGWLRRYRVRAWGKVTQEQLDSLKGGIEIEGIAYGPVEATLDKIQGDNSWLTIALREGKNREVRKILATLGLDVNRLIRVSFGPFQLLELSPGDVDLVRRRVMREQLGPELCRTLGIEEEDPAQDELAAAPPPVAKRAKQRKPTPANPRRPAPARGYDEDES